MSLSPAVGTSPSWPFFPFDQRCNKGGFRQGLVTGHRIRGAIAAYLLIAGTWMFVYELIALFI